MTRIFPVAAFLFFAPLAFPAEPVNAKTALFMWSAFECATYAEMSGDSREQERLFMLGFHAGRAFVEAIKNKSITENEARKAPIGVLLTMAGPTTDFSVGRLYEYVMHDAFDDVVKEDERGLPISDPLDWADDELKVLKAKSKYQDSNCALIR